MRYIVIGILLALSYTSANAATETASAFTATGATCGEITWQANVLERFPNIGTVCRGVVERDGKMYAQFKGIVKRRSGDSLYIRFEGGENVPGGDRAVKIEPPADMAFRVGNRSYKVRDAQEGQDLTIYIPGDRFVLNLGEDIAPAVETQIIEIAPMTAEPAPAEETPSPAPAEPAQAAEPAPTPEPVATEAPPPEAPVAAAPAPKEETPWLLIAGVLFAIIVIVFLVMRRRGST